MDLTPPISLYGDLPAAGPKDPVFGDPVWLNGDGQCFVWRTDTTPPQPLALGTEGCGGVRKLGSSGAPAPTPSALASFGGAADTDFLDVAPTPSIGADVAPGARSFVLYEEITTGDLLTVDVEIVGYMPKPFGGITLGVDDRYAVRTLRGGISSLASGSVLALPLSKIADPTNAIVQKTVADLEGASPTVPVGPPPEPAPKTTTQTTPGPLSSAGRVGSPIVWLGLGAVALLLLRGRR